MSRKNRSRRRSGLLPLALALAFLVFAVPAAAKGPVVINKVGCPPTTGKASASPPPRFRTQRERSRAVSNRDGFSGADAGILAGTVGVLVLMIAGGMLVAAQRSDAPAGPRMSSGGAQLGR